MITCNELLSNTYRLESMAVRRQICVSNVFKVGSLFQRHVTYHVVNQRIVSWQLGSLLIIKSQ